VSGAARLPRDLHPVAWWVWAIGLCVAASLTTNPLVLLLLVGVAALVVALRRSDQPWGQSFRLYVWLGVVIVVVRVVFRLIFGGQLGDRMLLDLPGIPLPHWVAGITLLGPVYAETLLAALYDGLRLATIVICIGAANSLANPKRLLRSVPPALYEIGTALVVAVTVLPQFAESARRVRAAQRLRAGETGRVVGLRRFLVPVLEDALDHSLALAAGMDTRGYGRSGALTRGRRRTTGALMLLGLCGVCVGTYAVLDSTAPRYLALPMLAVGVLAAGAGMFSAGRRVQRTRYRPDPWRWPELAVMASGVAVATVGWWLNHHQVSVVYPVLDAVPPVSGAALLAAAVGLLGALCSPPPHAVARVAT
jgi:energy-coupling factor transport system permease protein